MQQESSFDFIVIGSGIAGLNTALILSSYGKVLIVTKKKLNDSSTNLAQGGIAAVLKKGDSDASHIRDTLNAGYHHNKKSAVKLLVKNGAQAVETLSKLGVKFDKHDTGELISSYEAAHSSARIVHATDFTGREFEKILIANVLKKKNIEIWENTAAIDLIVKQPSDIPSPLKGTDERSEGVRLLAKRGKGQDEDEKQPKYKQCYGIQVLKNKRIENIFSRAVVLATGGIGQLYQWTTNPPVATGDGIAIAYRAGAKLKDLEFIQFHPTALAEATSPLLLLSEALRGEGAILTNAKHERFMQKYHPKAELAPRDVVSRAIFQEQKKGQIFLDISHLKRAFILKRFPNSTRELKKRGFDLTKEQIPVTPAAHFLCGGIATDLYGRTSIKNLFAYGETAATGVHGANRLASNSLLEGMVFPEQIKQCIDELPKKILVPSPYYLVPKKIPSPYHLVPKTIRTEVRQIMWQYVGIIRNKRGLETAYKKLKKLQKEIEKFDRVNSELLETHNMLTVALLITKAAQKRKKSLGTHFIKQ